jgi:hypothetical protein
MKERKCCGKSYEKWCISNSKCGGKEGEASKTVRNKRRWKMSMCLVENGSRSSDLGSLSLQNIT